MARPISYTPPPVAHDPGRAQVDDFVAALEETGLLRALTGTVRAYPDLAALVLEHVDADTLRSLAALGELGQSLDPEMTERYVDGVQAAVAAGDRAATAASAPSVIALFRELGDPDVRRGAGALLAALGAFGRAMRQD